MTNTTFRAAVQPKIPPLVSPGESGYPIAMSGFFFILMIAAMVAVLAALGMGLFSMVKGGEFNKKYGNKLMRTRVTLQGLALALFLLAVWSYNN